MALFSQPSISVSEDIYPLQESVNYAVRQRVQKMKEDIGFPIAESLLYGTAVFRKEDGKVFHAIDWANGNDSWTTTTYTPETAETLTEGNFKLFRERIEGDWVEPKKFVKDEKGRRREKTITIPWKRPNAIGQFMPQHPADEARGEFYQGLIDFHRTLNPEKFRHLEGCGLEAYLEVIRK